MVDSRRYSSAGSLGFGFALRDAENKPFVRLLGRAPAGYDVETRDHVNRTVTPSGALTARPQGRYGQVDKLESTMVSDQIVDTTSWVKVNLNSPYINTADWPFAASVFTLDKGVYFIEAQVSLYAFAGARVSNAFALNFGGTRARLDLPSYARREEGHDHTGGYACVSITLNSPTPVFLETARVTDASNSQRVSSGKRSFFRITRTRYEWPD